MTEPEARVRERQDGHYEPPVLSEPTGGPIPQWQPIPDDSPPEGAEATRRDA